MEYRKVGQSGLRVSALSIGGWLTFGARIDEHETARILDRAVAGGIDFIDLADVYARGEAERCVGAWLRGRRRNHLVLSSKVFWPMSRRPNDRGLSRKHVFESVDASLARLGTDYLDLYFCHRFDPETPLEETVRAMDDLVHLGKILYWGTSCWGAEELDRVHAICDAGGYYRPVVEQPLYNLLDRGIESDVLPAARRHGMGLVVWSPLAGGALTGKYNAGVPAESRGGTSDWLEDTLTARNLDRLRRFSALAEERGCRPEQLALAWILDHPEVSCAITGATRPEHVEHNLGALDVRIDPEMRSTLDALFSP